MVLPDISTLTETELDELTQLATQRLNAMQNSEERNRNELLNETKIRAQIARLENAVAELNTIIGGMQGSSTDKSVAQILRTVCQNMIRTLRVMGGILDSASTGEAV